MDKTTIGSFLCALKYIARLLITIWNNHAQNKMSIEVKLKNLCRNENEAE